MLNFPNLCPYVLYTEKERNKSNQKNINDESEICKTWFWSSISLATNAFSTSIHMALKDRERSSKSGDGKTKIINTLIVMKLYKVRVGAESD